uniref:VCBS domain-containing protein n=1 Tax=uncultured Shimia sp. TaxID=573152 RepID=UPI00262E59D9
EHATDIDTGDQLSVAGLTASHGTISGDAANGFTFTPDPNYNGPVQLSYAVTDGHGGTVAQTASLTLGATPDAAVITGVGASLKEDVGVGTSPGDYGKLRAYGQFHVTDPDGPAESQFPDRSFHNYTGSLGGSLQVNPDGQYIYHLDNSIVDHLKTGEEAKDHFVIHSVDGTTHPVEFTIAGTNDAPVVYRNLATKFEGDNVFNGQISAGDLDHDDSKTLKFTSGAPVAGFHLNSDGSYSFDPSNAAYRHLNDGDHQTISIPITVTDTDGLSSTGSLTVQVLGRNDAPVLSSATASATEDGNAVTGQMSATDVDGSVHTRQFSLGQAAPAGFTLNADGSWSFDPTDAAYQHLAAGATQQVTILVTVTDKQGATDTESLVITVTGTNDGPAVQTGDLGATQPGAGKTLSAADLLAAVHATDVDTGDQLSISNVQVDPQYGSFHQSGSNWVFTPTTGASQTDVPVTISVTDGHSTSSTTATLDVTAAPTPPTATQVHGSGTTHLSGTLTGGTGGWSIDNGHGGALSLQGQYGTLTIDPKTGHFEYDYRAQSAVIKSGGGGMTSGHHTDTFHILQHGTHTSDADVQVNINVQSVHGNSGHHVDHTTLIGIDIVPATPPQHDAPSNDEPIFEVTLDDDAQGPSAAGLGLTGEMDVSLAARADSADDPAGHDNRGFEPPNGHLGENPPPTHHIDPVNHYLDAVGASLHSDVPDQPQDAEQANPYTAALGVDADIPTDAPMLDPTMLDDPATATDLNSGSASSDEGIELPPDEPLVSLPEEDDPSANSG